MSIKAAVRIENLTKKFKKQLAVDRLSLEVPVGSVFGLLGENGAGKTTTIKMLLGLIAPDGGRLEVLGIDPARNGLEVRRRVGYVPEQPALYDWMTVAEIGWFAAGFHPHMVGGSEAYQRRFAELIQEFELPLDRKLKAISKGMKAKVSLALALASDPTLLVLDEPTSGLDVMVRRQFLESMVDLAGAGRTVLLSSHQIGEVERVASHVALVHKGKLILVEPLEELRARTFLVRFSLEDDDRQIPLAEDLGVELIDSERHGRQVRWLLHAHHRDAVEAIRTSPGVSTCEVETPSLEQIYVAYMRGRRESLPRSKPVAEPIV